MNSQRGLDVKEAIEIGQVAIALEIESFYILDPSNMVSDGNGGFFPRRIRISDLGILKNLTNIKEGKSERNLRFYGFHDTKGNYYRLSEFKGLYVKFRNIIYKITE